MKDADAVIREGNVIARADRVDADTRGRGVKVQLRRADDMDTLRRLPQRPHPVGRGLGGHEMVAGKLGVAVAEHLVDGAGDLAALDMGRADVVRRRHQRGRQRLHPVAMDDDQIGAVFGDIVGKARYGLGEDNVLRIARALVEELVDPHALDPVNLILGQPVAVEHVHAGDKEPHPIARVTGGDRQGFDLAEIGTGAGHEEEGAGHGAQRVPATGASSIWTGTTELSSHWSNAGFWRSLNRDEDWTCDSFTPSAFKRRRMPNRNRSSGRPP